MSETRAEITRPLVAIAAVVVIAYGMHLAAANLVQVLLAAFLAIITQPLVDHLRRRGWPMTVILSAAGLVLGGILFLGGFLASDGLRAALSKAPDYQEALGKELDRVATWLAGHGLPIDREDFNRVLAPSHLIETLRGTVGATAAILRQSFAVLLLVIFMWLEAPSLPRRLEPHLHPETRTRLTHNLLDLRRYMALKAAMSLLTGICVALWCLVMGVPFAFIFGVAAFFLNFVPVVGSILAALPAMAISFIDHGTGHCLAVTTGYLVINIGISNGLEPRVLGRGLGLSPLAIVLSLLVWGWILGPAGMLLSVPITMAIRALLKGVEGCEAWVAFLGNGEGEAGTTRITNPGGNAPHPQA